METAQLLATFAQGNGASFEVMLEIDSDGHRSGLAPDAPELVPIATFLQDAGLVVKGVMTHAGSSYECDTLDGVRALAEQERLAVVTAAQRVRAAGVTCPVVSVGSTPTALFAEQEIPWADIAFASIRFALERYFLDRQEKVEHIHFHNIARAAH